MKRIWFLAFAVLLILSIIADLLLESGQGHGEFPWSGIPGFFALFGLISCIAIILISKFLGHHWLQRREDYYDRDDDDE